MLSYHNDRRINSFVSELVGRSPLLEISLKGSGARLLLKLEQFNPTGSAKIRMARRMIDEAEASGKLRPGGRIVESTSGNTGMGLALIAAERGYRFTAVVDRHASVDKLRAMQAFGAELVYVGDDNGGLATADRDAMAERISIETGAYWTQQHNNPANANGYRELADELFANLGSDVTHLFGAVGTGGSLCGTARALKTRIPELVVVGVEPHGSVIFGGVGAPYHQSGTGTPAGAEIGAVIDYNVIDEGEKVSDAQAFGTARYLARHHALLVGGSAGGVIYRALRRARQLREGKLIVAIVCDGGEKYLNTVFDDSWIRAHALDEPSVCEELTDMLLPPRARRTHAFEFDSASGGDHPFETAVLGLGELEP